MKNAAISVSVKSVGLRLREGLQGQPRPCHQSDQRQGHDTLCLRESILLVQSRQLPTEDRARRPSLGSINTIKLETQEFLLWLSR